MQLKTPCELGYNCPYCKVVDNLHMVQFSTKCPIEREVYNQTVRDRYAGKIMPFVARTILFPDGQVSRYERRRGNMIQMEPKKRL